MSAHEQTATAAGLAAGLHAVVTADRDGIIREWNEMAERVLGYSAVEAVGQTLDLIIPTEERRDHWHNYRRAMAAGVLNYRPDHILDIEGLRRDGARIKIEATLIGVYDQARRLVGVTAILREAKQSAPTMGPSKASG